MRSALCKCCDRSDVDWTPAEPARAPHAFMSDVVDYLAVTFGCLNRVPATVRDALHFTSCTQIARALLDVLAGTGDDAAAGALPFGHVPAINMFGIHRLSLDLRQLEEYAAGCAVANLRECFAELRQTLQLLLGGKLEEHALDPVARFEMYPYVSLEKLARILEKYREPPAAGLVGGLGFGAARGVHVRRLRRKTVDFVLGKLRRGAATQAQRERQQRAAEDAARRQERERVAPAPKKKFSLFGRLRGGKK